MAVRHPSAALKPATIDLVVHDGHFWKAANINEDSAPAEHPVVTASHSEQVACVMRKTVG